MKKTIYRGDSDQWSLSVPLTIWSAGGKFFFAVKSEADTSSTDATAIIKKTFDDTYITSTTATDKVYTLTLLPSETDSATPGIYWAEFQWVNSIALGSLSAAGAIVQTFAPFKYVIKGDLNRRTS